MKCRVSISLEKSSLSAALVGLLNITVCSQLILGHCMLSIFFRSVRREVRLGPNSNFKRGNYTNLTI